MDAQLEHGNLFAFDRTDLHLVGVIHAPLQSPLLAPSSCASARAPVRGAVRSIPLSGGVLLLLALAAVVCPWHGFETHLGDRLLANLANSVRTMPHPRECLFDRS